MRRAEILRWIWQLESSFGTVRPAIEAASLLERYQLKDYSGMLARIAASMNLRVKLRIGYVNSGGPPGAPAWVEMPIPTPRYGSPEFHAFRFTVYIRKEAISQYPFEFVVAAMAHELSHILLNSTGHPLQKQEEAVDLTAMLFGYGRYFLTVTEEFTICGGYLSEEEIAFARAVLG